MYTCLGVGNVLPVYGQWTWIAPTEYRWLVAQRRSASKLRSDRGPYRLPVEPPAPPPIPVLFDVQHLQQEVLSFLREHHNISSSGHPQRPAGESQHQLIRTSSGSCHGDQSIYRTAAHIHILSSHQQSIPIYRYGRKMTATSATLPKQKHVCVTNCNPPISTAPVHTHLSFCEQLGEGDDARMHQFCCSV